MTNKLENEIYCLARAFNDIGLKESPELGILLHIMMNSLPIDTVSTQRFITDSTTQVRMETILNTPKIFEGTLPEYYDATKDHWQNVAQYLHKSYGVKE